MDNNCAARFDLCGKLQEEKKKAKEEEQRKRKEERAKKMAEFDKFKNPTGPNFVISKRGGGGGGGGGEVYSLCSDVRVIADTFL